MSERIPILFDRALRPEWIDFALEQFLISQSESELRTTLREFMSAHYSGVHTQQKTALQLQRTVGYKSTLGPAALEIFYKELSDLEPARRNHLRLEIICQSNAFFNDCVRTLRKLKSAGTEYVELKHLYERLVQIYGDRGMVHRRVRYVIQTLANFGCVTNAGGRWKIEECLG